MYVQDVERVYDLDFNGAGVRYGDVFLRAEREYSSYNFERADTAMLTRHFADAEARVRRAARGQPAAAGLRPVHQGEPPVQPVGRARRDQRDGTCRLYRPGPQRWRRRLPAEGIGWPATGATAVAGLMPELLLELFSEEIPARMQARAAGDLARLVTEALAHTGTGRGADLPRAAPHRAGLHRGRRRAGQRLTERGPRASAPERALAGFLRKHGAARDALVRGGRALGAAQGEPRRRTRPGWCRRHCRRCCAASPGRNPCAGAARQPVHLGTAPAPHPVPAGRRGRAVHPGPGRR